MSLNQDPINFYEFESLDSTQDECFRRLDAGESPGFVVVAHCMTAGRGRRQRLWASEPGRSLALSLCVALEPHQLMGLSLVAGLSVAETLSDFPLQLKWPNDLMLNDQKVGGILVESRSQGAQIRAVIGVGLNLLSLKDSPYAGLVNDEDASVGSVVNVRRLVHRMVLDIQKLSLGFDQFRLAYEKRMWRRGQPVTFQASQETINLKIEGVDAEGRLIVDDAGRLRLEMDGEILFEKS